VDGRAATYVLLTDPEEGEWHCPGRDPVDDLLRRGAQPGPVQAEGVAA
jgi:hypothetical protein